jgi:DNA-binding transcriptional MerR regulator
MSDLLDIGEVALRSGMAASTLRYYERQGIITSVERKGLRRQYQPAVLDTLAMVALFQRAGFNLAEIKALLATGGDAKWKVLAAQKRDDLRGKAGHLLLLAEQIDHALGCKSANAFDCEHFQAALRRALPVVKPVRSSPAGA